NHGVEVVRVESAQTGIHVPVESDDLEAGPLRQELRAPTEAARADADARTQVVESHQASADEGISRILPRRNRRDDESGRGFGRQVLQAVDRSEEHTSAIQ